MPGSGLSALLSGEGVPQITQKTALLFSPITMVMISNRQAVRLSKDTKVLMNVILRSVLCDEGSQPGHEGNPSPSLS